MAGPPSRAGRFISPGCFSTLGTPLVAGRISLGPISTMCATSRLVSENLARELWGSPAAALGKRIRDGTGRVGNEMVGVAGDVYDDGAHQTAPATSIGGRGCTRFSGLYQYSAHGQRRHSQRTRRHREFAHDRCAKPCGRSTPSLPLAQVRTLGEVYDQSMAQTSFTLVMLAIAGAMALLLGISASTA